ncbi:membrane protein insertion efficiency factor YidD [Patescibacteria group bacterium]|nr:membrane protein insertion efficiency factor YidD [Patescibacteria group bacterium]MBU0964041.1 membrane protein insertion efficiency factor YidD [Patescibacteria group bacterium]
MRGLVLSLIRLYQKTLSFDHGIFSHLYPYGYCRFRPTCSEYAYQAVEKYGVFKGGWMSFKRILKCNPFNKGGHDPVK